MELRQLPADVALEIWSKLDLFAQARLYATFDRAIHRSLVKVSRVSANLYFMERHHLARLFLQQLRNIKDLEDNSSDFSAFRLSVLEALNPLRVVINKVELSAIPLPRKSLSEAVRKKLERYNELATNLSTPLGLLNFARVFPRLETLRLSANIPSPDVLRTKSDPRAEGEDVHWSKAISFPSTLTSLVIRFQDSSSKILNALPSTLHSLEVVSFPTNQAPIPSVLSHLPLLSSLSIATYGGELLLPEPGFTLPPTLTKLRLAGFSIFPRAFMRSIIPTAQGLQTFIIERVNGTEADHNNDDDGSFDLAACLPPTVTDLTAKLDYQFFGSEHFLEMKTLPSTLTRLSINLNDVEPVFRLPVASFDCLTHLDLGGQDIRFQAHLFLPEADQAALDENLSSLTPELRLKALPINVLLLPKNLMTLIFRSHHIRSASKDAIKNLPPNLVSLSTPKVKLLLASEICAARPNLRLTCSDPIDLWQSSDGQRLQIEFSNLWSPVLDMEVFEAAVMRHYSLQRIRLSLGKSQPDYEMPHMSVHRKEFSEITTLLARPIALTEAPSMCHHFPHPKLISFSFPALVRLVVWLPLDFEQNLDTKLLPPLLTDLDIRNSTIVGDGALLNNLLRISSNRPARTSDPLTIDEMAVVHLDAPRWILTIKDEAAFNRRAFSFFNVESVLYAALPDPPTVPTDAAATVLPHKNPAPNNMETRSFRCIVS